MPSYVDLSTLHTPSQSATPPASWGTQVRDNFDTLAKPPRVKVTRTAHFPVPTAAATFVRWNSAVWDAGYDGVSPHWSALDDTKVFIRRTGRYLILVNFYWAVRAGGFRWVYAQVNGGTIYANAQRPTVGTSGHAAGSVQEEAILNSGDSVQLGAYQDSGSDLNLESTGTRMSLRWLGPS